MQPVKKFPIFHGTRRFITALTTVRHLSLSWASPIQSTYPHPTLCTSIPSPFYLPPKQPPYCPVQNVIPLLYVTVSTVQNRKRNWCKACWLFGLGPPVSPLAIENCKNRNVQNYNFAYCFVRIGGVGLGGSLVVQITKIIG